MEHRGRLRTLESNGVPAFVEIALSSLGEVESQLGYALETRVLDAKQHVHIQGRIELLRRMLVALMRVLQRRIADDENKRRDEMDMTAQP